MPYGTPVVDGTTYHDPFDGRNTAMSVRPSPSKSPTIGRSAPFPHGVDVATPVLELITCHTPVEGRNTPMSVLLSPSKSATTRPRNTVSVAGELVVEPALFVRT